MDTYQPDNLKAPADYRPALIKAYNTIVNQIGSQAHLDVNDVLPKIKEEFVGVKPGSITDSEAYKSCTKQSLKRVMEEQAPKLHNYIAREMGLTLEDAKQYFYDNVETSDFLLVATLGNDEVMVKEMVAANKKPADKDAKDDGT